MSILAGRLHTGIRFADIIGTGSVYNPNFVSNVFFSFHDGRVDSMEMLSVASRHQSRTTERDWENASTASSVASVAEYSGSL